MVHIAGRLEHRDRAVYVLQELLRAWMGRVLSEAARESDGGVEGEVCEVKNEAWSLGRGVEAHGLVVRVAEESDEFGRQIDATLARVGRIAMVG